MFTLRIERHNLNLITQIKRPVRKTGFILNVKSNY
ncbi:hypothetical protein [Candidatus Fukatsuia symbiotica]